MFQVILDTLLPSNVHPSLHLGIIDAGFQSFYPDFKRVANRPLRFGFQVAIFTAIWISPLLIYHFPPVTLYSRETRERALAAMETSRFYVMRQLISILKVVVSLCYGANREVRDAIGYPRQHDDPRNDNKGQKHP